MKNTTIIDPADEVLASIEVVEQESSNVGCQVRRKIEDYLERRRNQDDLGDFGDLVTE